MKITHRKIQASTTKQPIKASYDVVLRDGEIYRDKRSDDLILVKSKPIIVKVNTIEEAEDKVREFIEKYNLGGSQFTGGIVLENNQPVYYISYSGKAHPFDEFIDKWGKGIIYNSRVLKSLGYPGEYDPIISSTSIQAASTRDRIANLEERIADLQNYIDSALADGTPVEDLVDEQLELQELEDELRFAWADDEAEYNYALEQQEFNPDGSLRGYDDLAFSTDITAVNHNDPLEHFLYGLAQEGVDEHTVVHRPDELESILVDGEFENFDIEKAFDMYMAFVAEAVRKERYMSGPPDYYLTDIVKEQLQEGEPMSSPDELNNIIVKDGYKGYNISEVYEDYARHYDTYSIIMNMTGYDTGDDEDDEDPFEVLMRAYDDKEFMNVENEVFDDLGIYADFSSIRYQDGNVYLFPDPNHENDADTWMGSFDDMIADIDYRDYVSGVVENVLAFDESEWKERFASFIKSFIN